MSASKMPPPDVVTLLAYLRPEVRALAERARRLILAMLPNAVEIADQSARVIGYGYGPGYRDMVATLILSQKGVKLGLVGGASLPDPCRLLAGRGRIHRHIAFSEVKEVSQPAVKALVRNALAAWKVRTA